MFAVVDAVRLVAFFTCDGTEAHQTFTNHFYIIAVIANRRHIVTTRAAAHKLATATPARRL